LPAEELRPEVGPRHRKALGADAPRPITSPSLKPSRPTTTLSSGRLLARVSKGHGPPRTARTWRVALLLSSKALPSKKDTTHAAVGKRWDVVDDQ
jgi:hypothetical protein